MNSSLVSVSPSPCRRNSSPRPRNNSLLLLPSCVCSRRLHCTLRFEKKVWQLGARLVAGVDEVGRGSLFGPVVAAAVILDPTYRIRGLRDSKLLPAERREVLAERIREHCLAWAIAAVDAARIDQINIYQASRLAMRDAVLGLNPGADICWWMRCDSTANSRSNRSFTATPCPLRSPPHPFWPRSNAIA